MKQVPLLRSTLVHPVAVKSNCDADLAPSVMCCIAPQNTTQADYTTPIKSLHTNQSVTRGTNTSFVPQHKINAI